MSFISSGAAITLGGTAVYPAISTANAAGAGGAIVVGTKISVGTLTSTGTGAVGGAIALAREVVSGVILANGSTGGTVSLADECTTGTITSKPLTAAGAGGAITVADDCSTGNIDNSGTVAGTFGGNITIADRCEVGTITSLGSSGGGNITIGQDLISSSIDSRSTVAGNGGNLIISFRSTITGTINTSGVVNGGSVSIQQNLNLTGGITGTGGTGTSGPVSIGDVSLYLGLTFTAGTTVGLIGVGKFQTIGGVSASGGVASSGITIGDGTTIGVAGVTLTSPITGNCTIGNSVTIAGNFLNIGTTSAGSVAVGMGCNLQGVRSFANGNTGGITIGQATSATIVQCNNGGGVGTTAGNISLGAGCNVQDVYANSFVALGNSGNVVMEPGATAGYIQVDTVSGTGGNVTLKNSNVVTGMNGFGIVMGSVNTGTILAINARIQDFIDNVNGSSLFRDCIFSTPAANRNCIANLTASGSQYTNCLFVPNGTGVSIQATVPRTIIAYFLLQKNPFPVNVTLSEGSETTSANLLAP